MGVLKVYRHGQVHRGPSVPSMGRDREFRHGLGSVVRHLDGPVNTPDHSTGLTLLAEVAEALERVSGACEDPVDAADFADLAHRVRAYLASSRPTTPLGMPHIPPATGRLDEQMVVHRTGADRPSHVRIVRDLPETR